MQNNNNNDTPYISVIMPSYLGDYPGAAKKREQKFIRAIDSFLNQVFDDTELIIISDGCKDTVRICKTRYGKQLNKKKIILLELERHKLFTGTVRQAGINAAT